MAKTHPHFELVSFDICPYVQRSVITLKHKKVDFKLTLIDLRDPPSWFAKISPLGKVPLLLVRERPESEPTVLFESAVINEYVDEVTPPALIHKDPLRKAFERGWIEVGAELLMTIYTLTTSEDSSELEEARNDLWDTLGRVEAVLPGGRTFRGSEFSLVDSAFGPVFMRLFLFKSLRDDSHWKQLPKTRQWAESLLALPEVKESVLPDFKQRMTGYLRANGSALASEIV